MFISSMARKNSEKQRELDVKNRKDRAKRRDENWNEDLIVTGEMPVITRWVDFLLKLDRLPLGWVLLR